MPVISAVLLMCPPFAAPAGGSGAVLQIPVVGAADALFEAHGGRPAEAAQAAHVHELARRAVGLGGVPLHGTLVAHDALHELSLIHISEPTRLGMTSYAVFCLKKKKHANTKTLYSFHLLPHKNEHYAYYLIQ